MDYSNSKKENKTTLELDSKWIIVAKNKQSKGHANTQAFHEEITTDTQERAKKGNGTASQSK